MATVRSIIGKLLHDQAGDLAAEAVAAVQWRRPRNPVHPPLEQTPGDESIFSQRVRGGEGDPWCPCTYIDRFGHDPGCELSDHFAASVDAKIEAVKHGEDAPPSKGDPTNPQWPDRRDR